MAGSAQITDLFVYTYRKPGHRQENVRSWLAPGAPAARQGTGRNCIGEVQSAFHKQAVDHGRSGKCRPKRPHSDRPKLSSLLFKFCPLSGHELVDAPRGGSIRRVCPDDDCDFVHWDNPVPVVAAIVEHCDRVVLVRSHGRPDNWFGLVAGFLEKSEHPNAGMVREIEEEIGLVPSSCRYLGSYAFARMNQIIFAYHAEIDSLDIRLGEDELSGYKIVPVAELKPWTQGTGPALRDWLASRGLHPPSVEFGKHV